MDLLYQDGVSPIDRPVFMPTYRIQPVEPDSEPERDGQYGPP